MESQAIKLLDSREKPDSLVKAAFYNKPSYRNKATPSVVASANRAGQYAYDSLDVNPSLFFLPLFEALQGTLT